MDLGTINEIIESVRDSTLFCGDIDMSSKSTREQILGDNYKDISKFDFKPMDKKKLRKSTILWMLSTATTKISTDRLHRFVQNREEDEGSKEFIKVGDFIKVKWIGQISICSVVQFKFKNSKYKFMKSYCPIQHKDGDAGGQGRSRSFYACRLLPCP